MENRPDLTKRRTLYYKRKEEDRKDRVVSRYIQAKYPVLYSEATEFYGVLNAKYPTVSDLRKTLHFKDFLSTTKPTDCMVLQIPLDRHDRSPNKEDENQQVENHEVQNQQVQNHEVEKHQTVHGNDTLPDIDIDMNTLVPELPPETLESLMKELRADPNIKRIMDDIENQMGEVYDEIDDIDINIDDRLEDELVLW